jgi:hypothetical protein
MGATQKSWRFLLSPDRCEIIVAWGVNPPGYNDFALLRLREKITDGRIGGFIVSERTFWHNQFLARQTFFLNSNNESRLIFPIITSLLNEELIIQVFLIDFKIKILDCVGASSMYYSTISLRRLAKIFILKSIA